jgi:crotonobetainyl-CoA:carnitine CoA-transferase CaiB-like acyl-CoA transferase
MALCGWPDGPPRLAPGALATWVRRELAALRALAPVALPEGLDGPALLGERAALLGLRRRGAISPGGACRLLPAAGGWLAVALARPDDLALVPAWLEIESEANGEIWTQVAAAVRERRADEVVARARLLGLAASEATPLPETPPEPHRIAARGSRRRRVDAAAPLVLDLSALWAGPLCTHLLGLAGARVVKVESTSRPDGARSGNAAFFDLLNAGKASVQLDLRTQQGRDRLRRLVARADVVVESSRPRALRQMGIEAESLVAEHAGLVWVAISGYGRCEPGAGWIAYGDDAAVAAGLAAATGEPEGAPLFCGDAIADPLAGVHAAAAALAALRAGEAVLLDVALRDVVAHACLSADGARDAEVRPADDGFEVWAAGQGQRVEPPRTRRRRSAARPLGADTQAVLRELGC